MGYKSYNEALYNELQVCLNQTRTEINRADAYFSSKNDYDGIYLTHSEKFILFLLEENLHRINAELTGTIAVPSAYDDWTFARINDRVSPQVVKASSQRENSLFNKTPLMIHFGEFYGYTMYNILYKNYDWIKYALQKYNSDLYGCSEYQAAVNAYFEKAFAFYMRFENGKA